MKISKDTLARTICLALALLNQVLAILGKGTIDIADDTIYQVISIAFTVGTSALAWWKNNSFSNEAIVADQLMKELKENGGHDSQYVEASVLPVEEVE